MHDKKVKEDDFDVEAELKKPTVAQTGDAVSYTHLKRREAVPSDGKGYASAI